MRTHFVSRAEVHARTTGISSSCHQKFKSWRDAYEVYWQCYRDGLVTATPVVNGPFDPYRELYDLTEAFGRVTV